MLAGIAQGSGWVLTEVALLLKVVACDSAHPQCVLSQIYVPCQQSCKNTKRLEKTTPFGVNLMRSRVSQYYFVLATKHFFNTFLWQLLMATAHSVPLLNCAP